MPDYRNNKDKERLQRAIERGIIPAHLLEENPELLQGERHTAGGPQRGKMGGSTLPETKGEGGQDRTPSS